MVQERRVHQFLVICKNHTKQKKCSSIAVVFDSVNYRHRGKHKAGLFSGLRYLFSSNTALSTDRSNVAMQRRHFKAVYLFYSQQKQKKLHSSSFYSSMDLQLSGAPAGHMFTHSRSSFWVDSLIICGGWQVKRSSFSHRNILTCKDFSCHSHVRLWSRWSLSPLSLKGCPSQVWFPSWTLQEK